MKKKIKISLILSLAIIFGCFSNVFASTNQNNKIAKIAEVKKSVRLLDGTNDNGLDQYTKLLMHMDDNNFKDECGHTVANNNKVALDTNNKKFGDGSASFNGSDFLSLNNSDGLNFGSGDFTIDFWIKRGKINDRESIFGQCNSTASFSSLSICLEFNTNNTLEYQMNIDGTDYYNDTTATISDTLNWHHIAIVRNNGSLYLFIDGNMDINRNVGTGSIYNSSNNFGIGCWGEYTGRSFQGYIDEFRISNVARWTGKFTPPAASYGDTLATGILLNKTTDTLTLGSTGNTDTLTAKVTPDNATNKTVKWTSSNSDIVSVDNNGNIKAGSTAGTAIITATIDGTTISTTCTVTVTVQQPTNPTDSSDKAILNITMINGQIKQYNVTMDTVNKFITWYKLRSAGSGDPLYEFNITQTSNPSIVKTDYVVFDKISSFEVDDYTK